MNKDDSCLIDEMFRGVRAEIKAKDDIIMLKLEQILEQTTKTNGRVTKLEEQTAIGRWFERNPRRFIAVGVILVIFASIGGKEVIIDLVKLLI